MPDRYVRFDVHGGAVFEIAVDRSQRAGDIDRTRRVEGQSRPVPSFLKSAGDKPVARKVGTTGQDGGNCRPDTLCS